MSDEIKKTVLNTLAEPVANAAKNITDKPTQNVGTTLADIWYLVFGGISQAAEKRKLKYSYALQVFKKELQDKISKIPKDKLVEPDIQIIAKALEEAKYCVDKEELRRMFSSLISSSMNKDFYVSPTMVNIVSNLSPLNAKILSFYFSHEKTLDETNINSIDINDTLISMNKLENYLNVSTATINNSIIELERMNLICSTSTAVYNFESLYQSVDGALTELENTELSLLGYNLCKICLS